MAEPRLDYERLMDRAMRGIVRSALAEVAAEGLPGEHHFYIAFRTDAPGVDMPARLKAQYPEEMTIVVQHQYWNLDAGDDAFTIDLSFGGRRTRLHVPYAALTNFVDPSAQFGLKFEPHGEAPASEPAPVEPQTREPSAAPEVPEAKDDTGAETGEKVVSLDSFRKKEP